MNDSVIVPGWHPLVVHFPLALILSAVALLSAARCVPNSRWAANCAVVGTWNLCLGAVALLFALATGLAASIGLNISDAAHRAIGAHVKSAMLTALIVLLLAVWRGAGTAPDSRPSWLFVILLWAGGAALTVTGYRGAQNVYRYGIGVETAYLQRGEPGLGAVSWVCAYSDQSRSTRGLMPGTSFSLAKAARAASRLPTASSARPK